MLAAFVQGRTDGNKVPGNMRYAKAKLIELEDRWP